MGLLKYLLYPIFFFIIALGWAVDHLMFYLKDMNTCKVCGQNDDMFWFWVCSPLLIISAIGMGLCQLLEKDGY